MDDSQKLKRRILFISAAVLSAFSLINIHLVTHKNTVLSSLVSGFFFLSCKNLRKKMASDESMTVVSSIQEDEYDDIDAGFDHDHDQKPHPHNLSWFSMCTSSMYTNDDDVDDDDDDDDDDDHMGMYMSRLSIENFDADADEEFSDKELLELSSDSDKEPSFYSIPAIPPHRRNLTGVLSQQLTGDVKDYDSEDEAQKGSFGRSKGSKNVTKRRIARESCSDKEVKISSEKKEGDLMVGYSNYGGSFSRENEVGSGAGVVVITRPKGGRRSLCMDLEEVKACRDLGFELEHKCMLEKPPNRVSLSGSTLDATGSGGNSPISNWRISSPGDDPRDVKARLKVWAQAVAIVSTYRHCS